MTAEPAPPAPQSPPPPPMLGRPAEPEAPLEHLANGPALQALRQARSETVPTRRGASLRAWAARITGRTDTRLLRALADATETVAVRCDALVDRQARHEALVADLATTLGAELTQLRAEVLHLQRAPSGPEDQGG